MPIDKAKVYSDLLELSIDLNYDDNPTPGFIQDRTFECNEHNRQVEKISLQVTQELSEKKKEYNREKFNYESKKRQALTNNESIKKKPTGREREAAVEELLEDDLRNLIDLENEMNGLQDLSGAIRMVQNNLKATASDIRMLERVMEQQINRLNIGTKDDPEVRDLHKVFAEVDKLEEEMTMDDVESSTETTQDEPGDEPTTGTPVAVTPEGDGQGESGKVEEDEDTTASYLVDDSEDLIETDTEESSREEAVVEEDAQAEVADAAPTPTEPDAAPTGGKLKVIKSSVDIDLSEIGIDIGMDEAMSASTSDSTPTKEPPPPPPTKPKDVKPPAVATLAETGSKKGASPPKKKESPPAQAPLPKSVETPKKDITDIDLNNILDSLDVD